MASYLGDQEGELMMLDTVIAGCVTYLLEEKAWTLSERKWYRTVWLTWRKSCQMFRSTLGVF